MVITGLLAYAGAFALGTAGLLAAECVRKSIPYSPREIPETEEGYEEEDEFDDWVEEPRPVTVHWTQLNNERE